MRFKRNRKKISPYANMTPLIDVVLLLLFFFMLSATFAARTSIPIEVPETEGTPRLEEKEWSVTLQYGEGGPENEGRIFVNDKEIGDWGALASALSEMAQRQPDGRVLVRPDRRVPTGRTIHVLSLLNTAGIRQYKVEAQAPSGTP